MKNYFTKMLCAFILLLNGIFSSTVVNAQTCAANKVWACRNDACGIQECKCVLTSQLSTWLATVPKCSWKWHPNCCGGWRIGNYEPGTGIENSWAAFPNPFSTSTTISFSVEQSQNISIRVFDMNGRLVTTIADASFEEGSHEIAWNAEDVNAGIYFLQFQSEEIQERMKLVVAK